MRKRYTNLRVERDLYDTVQAITTAEGRTMTWLGNQLLRDYLARREAEQLEAEADKKPREALASSRGSL